MSRMSRRAAAATGDPCLPFAGAEGQQTWWWQRRKCRWWCMWWPKANELQLVSHSLIASCVCVCARFLLWHCRCSCSEA